MQLRFKVLSKTEIEFTQGQNAFKFELDLLPDDQVFSGTLQFTTLDARIAEGIKVGTIIFLAFPDTP